MSLPDPDLMHLLADDFVVGWNNIESEGFVGLSHGYRKEQTAVGTTNGAGGRNVQLVVLAGDGTVIHVLPGFWHPDDLGAELRFAEQLFRLWNDADRSRADKLAMAERMHAAFVARLSPLTKARSDWQPFDRHAELTRLQHGEVRDTAVAGYLGIPKRSARGGYQLRSIGEIVHERMLEQQFVSFADFDMESFTDYGRPFYDNNAGFDKGKRFRKAEKVAQERERAEAEAAAQAAKQAAKEQRTRR